MIVYGGSSRAEPCIPRYDNPKRNADIEKSSENSKGEVDVVHEFGNLNRAIRKLVDRISTHSSSGYILISGDV